MDKRIILLMKLTDLTQIEGRKRERERESNKELTEREREKREEEGEKLAKKTIS